MLVSLKVVETPKMGIWREITMYKSIMINHQVWCIYILTNANIPKPATLSTNQLRWGPSIRSTRIDRPFIAGLVVSNGSSKSPSR